MATSLKMKSRRLFMAAMATATAAMMIATPAAAKDKVKAAVIFGVDNPGSISGWDKAHYQGARKLIDQFGWDVDIAEGVPFPSMERTAERYAKNGYNVVIFTSSGQFRAWNTVAPKYPNTLFAMLSTTDKLPNAKNVVAYAPDFFAYGVLNGLVMAQATDSNKISAVSGLAVKAVEDMLSGIIEASKVVNPKAEFLYAFSGNWTDVPRAREVTESQMRQGADVVAGNAGNGTLGILDAVKSNKGKFVGYATDWSQDAPDTVLTSVLLGVDQWYEHLAKDVEAGKVEPKINIFGVDSFTVTPLNTKLLSADRIAKINDSVQQYKSGKLVIPVKNHEFKK